MNSLLNAAYGFAGSCLCCGLVLPWQTGSGRALIVATVPEFELIFVFLCQTKGTVVSINWLWGLHAYIADLCVRDDTLKSTPFLSDWFSPMIPRLCTVMLSSPMVNLQGCSKMSPAASSSYPATTIFDLMRSQTILARSKMVEPGRAERRGCHERRTAGPW